MGVSGCGGCSSRAGASAFCSASARGSAPCLVLRPAVRLPLLLLLGILLVCLPPGAFSQRRKNAPPPSLSCGKNGRRCQQQPPDPPSPPAVPLPPRPRPPPAPRPARPGAPNFVVIVTDDQDEVLNSTHPAYMPALNALLGARGTRFANTLVSTSVCCPARVSLWTGRFAHCTNVTSNWAPSGAWNKFSKARVDADWLPGWLQASGYRTIMVGKLVNGFSVPLQGNARCPLGWDYLDALTLGTYNFYNSSFSLNCGPNQAATGLYQTDVIRDKALSYIDGAVDAGVPFYLHLTPAAPHTDNSVPKGWQPPPPAVRHANLYPGLKLPANPTLKKPNPLLPSRRLDMNDPANYAAMSALYAGRIRSLRAVDEMLEAIVEKLRARGVLDNTYVIYTSDNGLHMGQHSLDDGKATNLEEDGRVPLFIAGPGVRAGVVSPYQANLIDLAPTLRALAGLELRPDLDGLPLPLEGPALDAYGRALRLAVQAAAARASPKPPVPALPPSPSPSPPPRPPRLPMQRPSLSPSPPPPRVAKKSPKPPTIKVAVRSARSLSSTSTAAAQPPQLQPSVLPVPPPQLAQPAHASQPPPFPPPPQSQQSPPSPQAPHPTTQPSTTLPLSQLPPSPPLLPAASPAPSPQPAPTLPPRFPLSPPSPSLSPLPPIFQPSPSPPSTPSGTSIASPASTPSPLASHPSPPSPRSPPSQPHPPPPLPPLPSPAPLPPSPSPPPPAWLREGVILEAWDSDAKSGFFPGITFKALRLCSSAVLNFTQTMQLARPDRPPALMVPPSPSPYGPTISCLKYSVWCKDNRRELYDLSTDPYEMESIFAAAPAALIARLDALLSVLVHCRGTDCWHPLGVLHPAWDVVTFQQAMHPRFDTFYAALPRFAFETCYPLYVPANERTFTLGLPGFPTNVSWASTGIVWPLPKGVRGLEFDESDGA